LLWSAEPFQARRKDCAMIFRLWVMCWDWLH